MNTPRKHVRKSARVTPGTARAHTCRVCDLRVVGDEQQGDDAQTVRRREAVPERDQRLDDDVRVARPQATPQPHCRVEHKSVAATNLFTAKHTNKRSGWVCCPQELIYIHLR